MQEFFRDVGFWIADNWTSAVLIVGLLVVVGIVLAYTALHERNALGEYRVLALVVAVVLAGGSVLALPLLRAEAEDACDEWSRSAEPADALSYVDNGCDEHF